MLPIACMGSNSGQSQRGGTPLPSEVSQKSFPSDRWEAFRDARLDARCLLGRDVGEVCPVLHRLGSDGEDRLATGGEDSRPLLLAERFLHQLVERLVVGGKCRPAGSTGGVDEQRPLTPVDQLEQVNQVQVSFWALCQAMCFFRPASYFASCPGLGVWMLSSTTFPAGCARAGVASAQAQRTNPAPCRLSTVLSLNG